MDDQSPSSGATLDELELLYRHRRAQFHRVAAAITHDRERARDAVQDAFSRAIQRRTTYARRGALEAWVWSFVVHAARDQLERPAPMPSSESTSVNGHPDDAVSAAVAMLPERQRLVLFLRYYADLDYAAIAEALGIAEGTVAATLHAAHRALHRSLQEARA